jgi:hypothetical protein
VSSTNDMTTKTLTPWFGSNRSCAAEAGRELAGLSWVGVVFAGGMSEIPFIGARSLVINDLHSALINLGRVVASPDLFPAFQQATEGKLFHPIELQDAQCRCLEREAAIENARGAGLFGGPVTTCKVPDVAWAVDYWVAVWMGRSANAGTDGEFRGNLSVRMNANGGDSAVRYRSATGSLPAWHRLLLRANFKSQDCFEFIDSVGDEQGHGLYCDPPFPGPGYSYKHKFTAAMHRRLAEKLAAFQRTRVVCRFYEHELVRELYPASRWTFRAVKGGRTQANEAGAELLLINGESIAGQEAA